MPKLHIKQLCIEHENHSLVDFGFSISSSTALIGQSGSGKSLTLKSILGLLPSNLKTTMDLQCDFELNNNTIGFIPQNPFTSLSPLTKIHKQFFCNPDKMLELLTLVGLEKWVLQRFPSELSGGQLQRTVIAMALSNNPKLLLLDEPTTALDEKSKQTITQLIFSLQEKLDFLTLYVTHDINSIRNICKDVVIIKNGSIVETGKTHEVLNNPKEEYTKQLIDSNFENKAFRK
jgi:peptide/nickel transport system ATP-binding protein